MAAIAVFTCHSSSHPFQERRIPLKDPVKIGRAVAKARPTSDNGIFDCKVLSRNHALIWYVFDQDGHKFYLQDTKSSNGTFINNQRLSRGAEESPAHELNSGDIIQFGVDVMENSRRGVVTHGCIVSQLTLYNPDGTEAVRSSPAPTLNYNNASPTSNNVPSPDLYQLSHYLKEALHREQMLEQKLVALQRLLSTSQEASKNSWQALIDEDRLLSRLEVLESQLRAYSKANSEESIRKELVALQQDKHNYESTAKESLKTALEEKLEACRKLSDMERMLSNSEDECSHSKEGVERLEMEQHALITKHAEVSLELKETTQKLSEAEKMHTDEVERLTIEKTELERKVDIASREEVALATRIEELQAECDFAREQLTAIKLRFEEVQEQLSKHNEEKTTLAKMKEKENMKINEDNEDGLDSQQIISNDQTDSTDTKDYTIENSSKSLKEDENGGTEKSAKDEMEEKKQHDDEAKTNGEAQLAERSLIGEQDTARWKTLQQDLEKYKVQLVDVETRLQESQDQVSGLQSQLKQAQLEAIENIAKANAIEEKLKELDRHKEEGEGQMSVELREIIEPIFAKSEERQLSAGVPDAKNNLLNIMRPEQLASLHNHIGDTSDDSLDDTLDQRNDEIERLKGKLEASFSKQSIYEDRLDKLKKDLQEMQVRHEVLLDENEMLKEQLIESQDEAKEAIDRADDLQEQLDRVEYSAKEVNDQILELRDQLMEEQHSAKTSVAEAAQTKQQLTKEQESLKRQGSLLEQIQKQLSKVEEKSLVSEAQTEDYQENIRSLKENLANEQCARLRLEKEATAAKQALQGSRMEDSTDVASTLARSPANATPSTDHLESTEECSLLRAKLSETEELLNRVRIENGTLAGNTDHLQTLLGESEARRETLAGQELQWQRELQESTTEVDRAKLQLSKALTEMKLLEEKSRSLADNQRMQGDDDNMAAANSLSKKYVPVVVILIAIVAALVQFFVAMTSSV